MLTERAQVIAMPGKLWLEIVQSSRQHGLDRGLVDRLHADLEARLEGADEMATDLQRCLELGGEEGEGIVGDDRRAVDTILERGCQCPVEIGPVTAKLCVLAI